VFNSSSRSSSFIDPAATFNRGPQVVAADDNSDRRAERTAGAIELVDGLSPRNADCSSQ
jgi:hypothetical protein